MPILAFILILIVAFKTDMFSANFWGGTGMPDATLFQQIRARGYGGGYSTLTIGDSISAGYEPKWAQSTSAHG